MRAQAKCMDFDLPSGQVVYANQPGDATLPVKATYYEGTATIEGQLDLAGSPMNQEK